MDTPLSLHAALSDQVAAFYATRRTARWMRRGMQAAREVSPTLALRLALRLFFTPLPSKLTARARGLPAGWRVEHLPFEAGRIAVWRPAPSEADRPRAVPDGPPPGDTLATRPRVLLVHGWAGHAGQLQRLGGALHAAGFDPVLLELPGHGHSDGWRSTLPQFVRALFALQARHGRWHAVIGHSMGALAVAHAAANGLSAQRLVLVAPPLPPAPVIDGFAAAFGLGPALGQRMREHIERHEGIPLAQFEPAWLAGRVAQPTLVLHDRDDRVAPFAWGRAFAKALPRAEWQPTDGLGHRRVLDDAQVVARVVAFLAA